MAHTATTLVPDSSAHYRPAAPTGVERKLGPHDLIVSKTDTRGRITYANSVFMQITGFTEPELIGKPHSIVRHPDMPRCVFKLLWDTIQGGDEIFAYVINLAKNGDHYWVNAHVTPSFDGQGRIVGFHSNRRAPYQSVLAKIQPLYAALLREEKAHSDKAAGTQASTAMLVRQLEDAGVDYERFFFGLHQGA